MDPYINIATDAARAAGNIIMRAVQRLDTIKIAEKGHNNFVTDIDQKAEQEIIYHLKKAYPTHSILGEESGETAGTAKEDVEYQWVIDPIDGTRNFIHGFPHFAVSIALLKRNRIEHGVIYDPVRQELFQASRGRGALLNNHRIRVNNNSKELTTALLGTGFAFRYANPDASVPYQIFNKILPLAGDIRRAGAATLDLAYVACGRLDGFWECGLHIWDIAAGILLVKEAGGIVSEPNGGEQYLKSGDVVAANPLLIKQILKVMGKACAE